MRLEISSCLDLKFSTSLDSSAQQIHFYLCDLMEDVICHLAYSPNRYVIIMTNTQRQQGNTTPSLRDDLSIFLYGGG
jgi:hypothetical protein